MSGLYCVAGVMHFVKPGFYVQIMPPYVPWHLPLVYLSGVIEFALGASLQVPRLRPLAAWGIVALLVAIYPANLYMWTADVHVDGFATPGWYHPLRLLAQLGLIGWAWSLTRASSR